MSIPDDLLGERVIDAPGDMEELGRAIGRVRSGRGRRP